MIVEVENFDDGEEKEYLRDFITYATKQDTLDITRVNKKNFKKDNGQWVIKPRKQVTPEMIMFTFSRYKTLVQQNTELKKQIEELKKDKLQLVETELKKNQTII